jgi:hypothetical protein
VRSSSRLCLAATSSSQSTFPHSHLAHTQTLPPCASFAPDVAMPLQHSCEGGLHTWAVPVSDVADPASELAALVHDGHLILKARGQDVECVL